MDFVWVYMQKMELRYLWEYGDRRYMLIINKLNEKRSLIPWKLTEVAKRWYQSLNRFGVI